MLVVLGLIVVVACLFMYLGFLLVVCWYVALVCCRGLYIDCLSFWLDYCDLSLYCIRFVRFVVFTWLVVGSYLLILLWMVVVVTCEFGW